MTKRGRQILFEKVGMAYMPVNQTGWILGLLYCALAVLSLLVPAIVLPHSRIMTGYQVVAFLFFWWLGLRFAKRHSA